MPDGRCQNHVEIDVRVLEAILNLANSLGNVSVTFSILFPFRRLPSPEQVLRLWQDGAITNFDYLMQLNKLAGRTFNDLMQYPIFPFVLSDYTSDSLDLHAEKTFRNLRKPIAIQVWFPSLFIVIGHARLGEHNFRTRLRRSGTLPTTTLSLTSWKEMSRTMTITSWMKTRA